MHDSSLIKMLRSFSAEEIKEFDKVVASPYFNNQRSITSFYKLLRKYYPDFDSPLLKKEKIFGKLYPQKKYSSETIRRLASDLKQIAERYLSYKVYDSKPVLAGLTLIEDLFGKNLMKEIEKELNGIGELLDPKEGIDQEYFRYKLEYETMSVQYFFKQEKQQQGFEKMMTKLNYLYFYFFVRLAYYLHDVLVNRIIFTGRSEGQLSELITSKIDFVSIHSYINQMKEPGRDIKAVDLYILDIINNLDIRNETYYKELITRMRTVINDFNHIERYNIYQMVEGICWRKMEAVDSAKYQMELFEINKMRLEDNAFSPDGKVMRFMLYRQVLLTAIRLQEYDWCETFIYKYSDKLAPELREDMKLFSLAQIDFSKGNFSGSLDSLKKINESMFLLKFDLKNLLLRIYYELSYFEESFSLIDTYRHFLINNKSVSEHLRTLNLNFVNYLSRMLRLKLKPDEFELQKCRNELEQANNVNFKEWLISKAAML